MYDDNYAASAPAYGASAMQMQNDAIEMDRYRAASHYNQGNNYDPYAQNPQAPADFNGGAVYVNDGDANSVDENVAPAEVHPHQGYHGNGMNDSGYGHGPGPALKHYKSASIRAIEEPRDAWASNPASPKPTAGLRCLWVVILLSIVACLAMVATIDSWMVNILIHMDAEGSYMWSLGWRNAEFTFLNNAKDNQVRTYPSVEAAQPHFPIPNSKLYLANAGYLLIATALLALCGVAYILLVLCSRYNQHILLYINCCCCRIPQRASVYFAFDCIKLLCWAVTTYYLCLCVYALLETTFYLVSACPPGTLGCGAYPVPHFGFLALLVISFSITCCAFTKVQNLDLRFNLKSMQLYYPENLRKAESRNCSLKLELLFKCVAAAKYIIITSFVMVVSFRDVGLLMLVFHNKSKSVGSTVVAYLQFQGLSNSQGIAPNVFLDECSENPLACGGAVTSSVAPVQWDDASSGFETIAYAWNFCLMCILCLNLLLYLPCFWGIILRFRARGKFLLVLLAFIQWLLYTVLLLLYYYEFYVFLYNVAKPVLQSDLQTVTGDEYGIYALPDWGIFVALMLWAYLLRLMYVIFKAM